MADEPPEHLSDPITRRAMDAGLGGPNRFKQAVAAFEKAVLPPPPLEMPRLPDFPNSEELASSIAAAEDAKRHAAARAVSPVIEQHTTPIWQAIVALRASQEQSARQLWALTLAILILTVVIALTGVGVLVVTLLQ